jgi:hypothetical protein
LLKSGHWGAGVRGLSLGLAPKDQHHHRHGPDLTPRWNIKDLRYSTKYLHPVIRLQLIFARSQEANNPRFFLTNIVCFPLLSSYKYRTDGNV